MVDYMVRDTVWNDYAVFTTEQEARDYVQVCLDTDPASARTDFVIFKRERIG
jgi:hypothetical protein